MVVGVGVVKYLSVFHAVILCEGFDEYICSLDMGSRQVWDSSFGVVAFQV